MNKRELVAQKTRLTHEIRNIRFDYQGVAADDMPAEVTTELNTLTAELMLVRSLIEAYSNGQKSKND
jgi:hypothetical protein